MAYVDALRGIAAFIVLYFHVAWESIGSLSLKPGPEYSFLYFFTNIEDLGKTGIVLFFAISGFIIPASFGSKKHPALTFVVSRFFRLYPAYWASLAIGVLVYAITAGKPLNWAVIAANVTMIQTVFGKPDIVGVYWTLFIEWIFYVFCLGSFLLGWLGKIRFSFISSFVFLFLALAAAFLRYQTHRKIPVAILLALSIMVWASLWREQLLHNDRLAKRFSSIWLCVFCILLPIISYFAYNFDSGHNETWYRYTISYLTGLGLFLFFTRYYRLESPVFLWLGSISYSLYLLHAIVIEVLERLNSRTLPFGSAHLFMLEVAIASLLLAYASYRWIEKPAVRLGGLVRNHIQKI